MGRVFPFVADGRESEGCIAITQIAALFSPCSRAHRLRKSIKTKPHPSPLLLFTVSSRLFVVVAEDVWRRGDDSRVRLRTHYGHTARCGSLFHIYIYRDAIEWMDSANAFCLSPYLH